METLKLPQTFGEPSSLRASVSVESLLLRDREDKVTGSTFEPTTMRSDSLFDVRGQSLSPVTTNLHHVGKVLFFPVIGTLACVCVEQILHAIIIVHDGS